MFIIADMTELGNNNKHFILSTGPRHFLDEKLYKNVFLP